MKKLVFWLIAMFGVTLASCSWFDDSSSDASKQEEYHHEETPYWHKSHLYRTVVTYKSNGPHAWHRVWFRIDGRSHDSFENNVDCYNSLKVGDSILVEEVFSSVIHYYKICKINH